MTSCMMVAASYMYITYYPISHTLFITQDTQLYNYCIAVLVQYLYGTFKYSALWLSQLWCICHVYVLYCVLWCMHDVIIMSFIFIPSAHVHLSVYSSCIFVNICFLTVVNNLSESTRELTKYDNNI